MGAAIGLKAVFSAEDRGVTATVARLTGAVKGLSAAGDGLAKVDALNSRIAGDIKATAVGLGTLGLGAGLAAKNVVDAGADFEQAITNVGAVSLMTRDQIAPLEALAKRLGATTKFSATEVANAMEEMGKAGLDNSQILAGVGGILSATAADGGELAETAANISSVLKGMGLAADDTTRVADVLALASVRTKSSIGSLGESMSNVASTARQLGVPLEDTVAMVALLQDVGLDASEAGSALNTMLSHMAAPSKEAAAQMAAMGVKFEDAAGNMLAPTKVLEQLVKAGKGAGGNMKQVAFFTDLVGLRGQKAAINLKDLFASGKVTELTDELYKAQGVAGKIADIRMDTFKGDIETLGGSIDSLKIRLFELQGGPLRGVVQGMTAWLDANSEVIASGVNDFIRDVTPLVIGFGEGMRSAFQELGPHVKGVASALGIFKNDTIGAQAQAYFFAKDLVKWGTRWVEFTIAVKAGRIAIFAFSNATRIARGVAIAYNFTMGTLRAAVYAYQVATGVGTANTVALAAAMNTAQTGAAGMEAATAASAGGLATWAARAGAAAAAAGALYLAWNQLDSFQKENGGWEGVAGFLGIGTSDFGFAGVDEVMNKQAMRQTDAYRFGASPVPSLAPKTAQEAAFDRIALSPTEVQARRLDAPLAPGQYAAAFGFGGMPAPPAAAPPAVAPATPTASEFKAMVQQELTVNLRTDAGTSAEVTKKPPGAKVNLQASGAP